MARDDKPTGGPAFPQHGASFGQPGMTLRDWFAGQALASIMQDRAIWDSTPNEERDIARRMYRWADAMLGARSE